MDIRLIDLARIQRQLARRSFLIAVAGPLLSVPGYWLGGEPGLVVVAVAASLAALAATALHRPAPAAVDPADPSGRRQFLADIDQAMRQSETDGTATGCIVLQFDNAAKLLDRHGRALQTEVIRRTCDRLVGALQPGDRVMRLEGGGVAVSLAPARWRDLESLVQLSARLQGVVAEPMAIGRARYRITCSVGFCEGARMLGRGAAALLDAAQIAADEALRLGPGALRAYSPDMARKRADRDARRAELEIALDTGQIVAWFQPQVSADTGEVAGFEALARWQHPDRGLIPPGDFLSHITEAGLSERLSEVMLFHAMVALSRWDKAGYRVPCIGVNFCSDELRNPHLADKLTWELDRFNLTPDRLSVEVLETVVAEADHDVIARNITALARMGCRIDLDDFGTGHTSIANIRRFAVHRLKIDRSFVTRLDQDREQQRIVTAVLSMADRLGLETLAEGVETRAELAILAQLGCSTVQGYAIGRPMPFDATLDWLNAQRSQPRLLWMPTDVAGQRGATKG